MDRFGQNRVASRRIECEAGVEPLIAMKIVGYTDYKPTANIYTHVRDEMLRKATVNPEEVFGDREK